MVPAIIAGAVTLLVVVAVVVFALRQRGGAAPSKLKPSHSVESVIDTVGVAPEVQQTGFGVRGHAQVQERRLPSVAAGDAVNSRFVAMGVVGAAIFGALAAKLWSMQVLQGAAFAQASEKNLYTTVYTPAPRGVIYDCDGVALVANRQCYAVLADADVADDADVVRRLSTLLGIPAQVVRQRMLDTTSGAQSMRVVESDASMRNVAFISEHPSAFPGIHCEMRTQRTYPYGALAAHVLGYSGVATDDDLAGAADITGGRDLQPGDIVGHAGVEYTYEHLLAGDHGTRTLLTDASGNVHETVSETNPTRGNDIYLTLRAPVQQVADQVLRSTIAPNGVIGGEGGVGSAGGIVCLDLRNGEVVALANFPTFTPESFVGGIPTDVWESFNTRESLYPLMNRVVAGTYPAASTYKAFVSMAALSEGIANSGSSYDCTGRWTGFGESYAQRCWMLGGHGVLDLQGGIAHSCDTVFYEIAKGFFESSTLPETALQEHIAEYGFGERTGIDLSGEAEGRVPTPAWKAEEFRDAPEEGMWVGGDMSNMCIGQGYVLVTPLQLACGYAGIATGRIWRPHLLREVRNGMGDVVLAYQPEVSWEPVQQPAHIDLVRQGLKDVMTVNRYGPNFFGDFPFEVAGKTGTAQVTNKKDYSWFACYAPADDPRYVCACLIEEGMTAANCTIPAVATVMKAAFDYDDGLLTADSLETLSARYEVGSWVGDDTDSVARED